MVGKSGQPFKKSRNYGESADDLQDRLDVVAALLALADEEITIPSDSLKAQFKLEWVKENELRVSGTVEQKQGNLQRKPTEKGITKKDLGVLLETYRQKPILEKARDELIQNALTCLRDLGIIQDNSTRKNQGYWQFHLCLKHQTAKREDNLQVIKNKWQEAFGQLPELKPLTPTTATLQRCILGLRGNYQDAQQKLAEISHVLQTRFKDKTLSITKVEQGRIILIVESSQTGYEQFKRLIGQEIAGFSVDYAIDEWQAICRQMLIDRKPLTSNTVIGRVYGDRNLIDEDLFVDLALVKPKRSKTEKHPQEIDPEKGSDLYNREQVEKRLAYREFLEEVISNGREKQLAIIGEPGAGKTTLLQKLAFWLLQETDDLVIWVDLAELGNQPLGEYLEQKWLKEALGLSREAIKGDWEQKFKGGAVWLLLDGLDEMSQSDQQALNFRGWVMNAPIIVTCRLNLWQANPSQLQGFQTYLTQPFQDEQVQEFIRRWFLVEADAELLWSQLQAAGKERIKDLCRNPLRLTLLCATWKLEDALPETMAQLYAEFVESMYAWKETAFAVTEEDKERLNVGLGVLAKASLEAETGRFRLTHRLVCEHLGKPKAQGSLFPLALRLGWLNEVGVAAESPREKVYGFYHATFQEYFAALAVADWDYFLPKDHVDCPVAGKRYRIFEPQWKQVILLWLGREDIKVKEKKRFIRALVQFKDGCGEWKFQKVDRGFYEYRAYFLAANGIDEFKCLEVKGICDQMFKWFFGDLNHEKQNLKTILDIISLEVKKNAGSTIKDKIIRKLSEIINSSSWEKLKRRATESLGEIGKGNPKAIAALEELITITEDENTRRRGIYSLSVIDPGNSKAILALVDLISKSQNDLTSFTAPYYLEKNWNGNPEAIDALIEIFEKTKNEETRKKVAFSLEKIGKGNPKVISTFIDFVSQNCDNDFQSKQNQKLALYKLSTIAHNNQKVVAALSHLIDRTHDEETQILTAFALGLIDNKNLKAITILNSLIGSQDSSTQLQAAFNLGVIDPGNSEAIMILVRSLKTTTYESELGMLSLVGKGNKEVIAALEELIDVDSDPLFFLDIAHNLGRIDKENTKVTADLVKFATITTNQRSHKKNAINILLDISKYNPKAIYALKELTQKITDEFILVKISHNLGMVDEFKSDSIRVLKKLLNQTRDELILWQASESLGTIDPGNLKAMKTLLQLIEQSEDESIRMQAAQSLRKILKIPQQYAEVVSALKDNLSDDVYQNDLDRFEASYEVIWNCAENLPYPEFYQAWHNPPTTPHPEITDQTPHNSETTFAPINLPQTLQHQPILILNAQPLANETREGEIALTLSELIWDTTCPDEDPPEPTTPAQLRRALKQLQRRQLLPHRALLLTDCEHPTPELISFCETLTGVIAIAVLTDDPLDAPLKGFPPNQPNLISAIETWLEEI